MEVFYSKQKKERNTELEGVYKVIQERQANGFLNEISGNL